MKYLSICSGIEAASVAWEQLGWEAVGFSEIEPFPCAVLRHRFPDVPLHGDFTALIESPPSCDVLVGGTPCQAFSVAGSRRSLDDARGNLTLAYVMLADAIDRRNREEGKEPCITVWENVPGVFSTKDNAFGAFLGGLSGEDGPLEPPGGKWTHCGAVLGPQRAIAWRVQDAQYHGLAQRRQRVFVVASARNGFDPSQVLLEWEGVRRDSAPSREARKNPATASGVGVEERGGERGRGRGRGNERGVTGDVVGAGLFIPTSAHAVPAPSLAQGAFPWPQEVADPLTSNEAKTYTQEGSHNFRTRNVVPHVVAEGDADEPPAYCYPDADQLGYAPGDETKDEAGVDVGASTPTQAPFVFDTTQVTHPANFSSPKPGDPSHPLAAAGHPPTLVFESRYYTRKNKTAGVPDEHVTSPLRADLSKVGDGFPTVAVQYGASVVAPSLTASNDPSRSPQSAEVTQQVVAATAKKLDPYLGGDVTCAIDANYAKGCGGTSTAERPVVAQSAYQVRRLTPRECERLQGFPDDWTLIPWKGKPAVDCPDGPRYKALGNSMAVPVMRWIGRRIAAYVAAQENT